MRAGQLHRLGHPRRGIVEHDVLARDADRPAEHDDAVDLAGMHRLLREAVLQRPHQDARQRAEGERDQDRGAEQPEPARRPGETREGEQASEREPANGEVHRRSQKPDDLGEGEEHGGLSAQAFP